LEDCALAFFSCVFVARWFFCSAFTVFTNVLWWLGSFFYGALVGFFCF
jgi:hypothetical protein